jgi:transcriptional regulator GlxA family with amidase domain
MKKHFILILCLISLSAIQAAEQAAANAKPIIVGILVFDKAYITEFAGPLDVYHHMPADKLKVVVISGTTKDLTTYEGLPFHAEYTIADAPKLDVLVVPSGAGSLDADPKNKAALAWIKKTAADAKFITSHCEGAFLLAEAGLLAGKQATTFHSDVGALQSRYPTCSVQGGKRVVVDGNLVTSAGGLASYEGALYVIARLFGEEEARRIASALAFDSANTANALERSANK